MIDEITLAEIFAEIASGAAVWRALQQRKISARKFYATLDANESAAEGYARAKAIGLDRMADDTLRIADNPRLDANDKRVMVDTRKWLLSKLAPKKYGERTVIAGDADNPLAITEVADPKAALLRGLAPKLA